MPNLNAVLGVAQMQTLPSMMSIKTEIAAFYADIGEQQGWHVWLEQRIVNVSSGVPDARLKDGP